MFLKAIPRQRVIIQKEEIANIFRLILRGKLIKGDCIEKFEVKFAAYIGTKFALCVASGRLGLQLILKSLGLEKGDEVIIPAYTFHIVPEVVRKAGFSPVFIDIDREDCNLNVNLIEEKITKRTKVIIATHLFGKACELYRVLEIAKKYNLFVIEDCAQAIGAEYYGQKVGSFGDCAYFSFETTKPFHTFGGGMIVTNNQLLSKNIRNYIEAYQYPGIYKMIKKIAFTIFESLLTHPFFFTIVTYPLLLFMTFLTKDMVKLVKKAKGQFKLLEKKYTNFQASVGLVKLNNLDRQVERRIANAKILIKKLNEDIYIQKSNSYTKPIYYYVIIKSRNANIVSKILLKKGLDVDSKVAEDCSSSTTLEEKCPVARRMNDIALQIPMYPQLTKSDINSIANILTRNLR